MPAPSSSSKKPKHSVPFFILNLDQHGKTKVLFTVPSRLAETLIQHPVLCRGGIFDLRLDPTTAPPPNDDSGSGGTCFLSTEFDSPHPEATARAISLRLATRLADSSGRDPLSTIFGL